LLQTLENNISQVIDKRQIAPATEIENEISTRQNELLALTRTFNRTAEDFETDERLASVIEYLRSELSLSHKLEENINLSTFGMNEISAILGNTFETFDDDLFIDLIDKVLIREHTERTMKKLPPFKWLDKTKHTALFIFKCGIEAEEPMN
jgi:hypothetical protein